MSRQQRKELCRKIKLRADADRAFHRELLKGSPLWKASMDAATVYGAHYLKSKPWWFKVLWKLRLIQAWWWLEWLWLRIRRKAMAEIGYSDEFHFSVEERRR